MFGQDLVYYALNLDRSEDFRRDDPARADAFAALIQIGRRAADIPDEFGRRLAIVNLLFGRTRGEGPTFINELRVSSGGQLPAFSGADEVAEPLYEMALDFFALRLLPPFGGLAGPRFAADINLTALVFRHPANAKFCRRLLADAELTTLFPGHAGRDDEPITEDSDPSYLPFYDVGSQVIWSTGSGGGLNLIGVAEAALSYAYSFMRIRDQYRLEQLPSQIDWVIGLIRQLARRQVARLSLVASLTNSGLRPGQQVAMARGSLAGGCGSGYLFPHLDASDQGFLLVDVDVRLLDVLNSSAVSDPGKDEFRQRFESHMTAFEAAHQANERELTRARLAIILASDTDQVLAPRPRTWAVPSPLMSSGGWSMAPERMGGVGSPEVTDALATRITAWSSRLQDHPESLWLGARRLVAAVSERADPLDAFIDAVVCWENMFGTGAGEVTFRVCASLATVIEPIDATKRGDLFDELRKLYYQRSGLVHGSREPSPREASEHRKRAIEFAIQGLQRVYDRPELRDARDSSARSRTALLGA